MSRPKILVILGPTATGKSDIAVNLAKKFEGEVISADSRQVYKEMDLGTGKITKKEMFGIPHHLLDIVNPQKQFSVADFQKLAQKKIREILKRKKLPIIWGGTGFYIEALIKNISLPAVPPNTKLRKELSKKTTAELLAQLEKLDPARAKTIDAKNPRRLIRAIEITKALGSVPPTNLETLYDTLQIGLTIPDRQLKQRINLRLKKRLKMGMLAEAKRLHKQGLSWKRMEELGLEYRYQARYLSGKISKEQMIAELSSKIWQYAKRQKTWFKRDKNIIWINPLKKSDVLKIEKLVKKLKKR
jgi:tRNA dimethylallyltransferase